MGNEYRTEKKILASELFDGRLQKFGIHERSMCDSVSLRSPLSDDIECNRKD
jgi:hypothetical protein